MIKRLGIITTFSFSMPFIKPLDTINKVRKKDKEKNKIELLKSALIKVEKSLPACSKF